MGQSEMFEIWSSIKDYYFAIVQRKNKDLHVASGVYSTRYFFKIGT